MNLKGNLSGKPHENLTNIWAVWLIVVAVVLHVLSVSIPRASETIFLYEQNFSGERIAPFRYRILHVWLVQGIRQLFPQPDTLGIILAAALLSSFALAIWLWLSYRLFCRVYSEQLALIGLASLVAADRIAQWQMATAQQDVSYSWIEAALFASALHVLLGWHKRPRPVLYGLIVLLGSLNRETALILVIWVAGVVQPQMKKRRALLLLAGYGGLWVSVFWGLRLIIPATGAVVPVVDAQIYNLNHLSMALIVPALFFGPWPILVRRGWRLAPHIFRQVSFGTLLYLCAYILFARWWEIRVVLPIMPVLVGTGLAAFKSSEVHSGTTHA
ncbi:MAG: hypothetical protein Kow0077_25690 [Anaerolineae bacterium]